MKNRKKKVFYAPAFAACMSTTIIHEQCCMPALYISHSASSCTNTVGRRSYDTVLGAVPLGHHHPGLLQCLLQNLSYELPASYLLLRPSSPEGALNIQQPKRNNRQRQREGVTGRVVFLSCLDNSNTCLTRFYLLSIPQHTTRMDDDGLKQDHKTMITHRRRVTTASRQR